MKKSKLCKAVALATALGGLGAGIYAPTAGAVNMSANGLGEVLIFPYYTTRDNWQTTLTIINTDEEHIVAVKLRFMEGENSRDTLDFNVIMSPGDVFAAVVETDPTTGTPRLRRTGGDTTCTSPVTASSVTPWVSLPLNKAAFTGSSEDGGHTDDDRMREGYVLATVMGQADVETLEGLADATDPPSTVPGAAADLLLAIHTNGVNSTADCQAVDALFSKTYIGTTVQLFGEPDNVLKGNYSFINVPRGTAAGGNAVTLANMVTFSNDGTSTGYTANPAPARSACSVPFFSSSAVVNNGVRNTAWAPDTDPSSCPNLITAQEPYDFLEPSLDDAYPAVAVVPYNVHDENLGGTGVFAGVGYQAYGPGTGTSSIYGFQAVSEVLRATTVVNEWSANPALGVSTDWVVTHPTKAFFVDRNPTDHQAALNQYRFPATTTPERLIIPASVPIAPFAEAFDENDDGRSCNLVAFRIWNRDEVNASPGGSGTVPSPAEPEPNLSLCYETNVIPFSTSTTAPTTSAVFGSRLLPAQLSNLYSALNTVRPYGWMQLELDADTAADSGALNGPGLPAVGFMIRERAIPASVIDSYSDLADHSMVKELNNN